MKFLLKIVQGPNAGAEIALVEGVRVTLGSADSCDIVLADPTLPAEACAIEASADSVVLEPHGGASETLAPLQVRSFGSTALAVGPADAPWGPLAWEAPSRSEATEVASEASAERAPEAEKTATASAPSENSGPDSAGASSAETSAPSRSRILRLGGLVLLLLLLLLAAWLFARRWAKPASPDGPAPSGPAPSAESLPAIAERYGLAIVETNGATLARGNFATRAERLAATAALYEAKPGIKLDLADRETLLSSASDLLAAATDGTLTVADVTNRVAVLAGRVADPATLQATLDALRADVPRLAGADTAAVALDSPLSAPAPAPGPALAAPRPLPAAARRAPPRLPLCGILLQPYPCLVLQDGRRLAVGSELSGYKIVSIAADRIKVRRGEEEELEWTP